MAPASTRTYLDHNATSPLRPEARGAIAEVLDRPAGNPSSLHTEGRAARATLEQARERVAALAGASAAEVVFTSGGSEAIAAGVRGVTDRAPSDRRRIVVSEVEHSAVLEAAGLAAHRGFVVVRVPCNSEGRIEVERFGLQLGPDVALACLQLANNETGVLQPVEEVGRLCRSKGIPLLVDAVQAAGKTALDPRRLHADLLALSSHKIGGPQGAGALIVREGIALTPLIGGGAQEMRRRGGTEAVALLAGFGAASAEAVRAQKREAQRMLLLRAKLETRLREAHPDIRYHGEGAPRLPNTVNFALPGIPGETLVIALDLAGFAVSTGSACASGAVEPSHVIQAMGLDEDEARAAVRVSLGWNTDAGDIDRFVIALTHAAEQAREGLGMQGPPQSP